MLEIIAWGVCKCGVAPLVVVDKEAVFMVVALPYC